ncbi:hypothetical protein KKE48_00050 [Patescibacteria group bacterium]|nr:hypothetical protein [Patescibacteria group bacterium]
MNGLWHCAKYAFSPNYLKYCGPDKNQELAGYLKTKTSDLGLEMILKEFRAMEPYLKLIARENGIADTFDEKVVEAYWLGNELLEAVSLKSFFNHNQPRLAKKDLRWFEVKLGQGAKPNHSFHVFNFWKRTGHLARLHTIETMDNCRISWGEVTHSTSLRVKTNLLVFKNGRLELEPTIKEVQSLEGGYKPGDLVTIHWNCVCEKVTVQQAKNLQKYTDLALRLANLTI